MKFCRFLSLAALALAAAASPAAAKVDVVAANQDLAWVAKAVGGDNVSVDFLASSGQDPHAVEPRPSQVVKLSRADLAVRIGMDLDLWFDALIRSSGNGKIAPNGRGYVDASRGIRALEVPSGKLDPSKGDIHVYGNPHYFWAPSNLPIVARNVTAGLKRVDPSNAGEYDAGYNALVGRLNAQLKEWRAKLAGDRGKSVITYHKSLVYFLHEFGLRELANVEPRPGVEPTAGHVARVAREAKEAGVKAILTENYRSRRFADLLARQSGASVVVVPGGIGAERGLDDYFSFMTTVVNRIAGSL